MINRILIRMKVVQLLYSYMLTRCDFKLAPRPEKSTRDNNFGYETYLNLILLLLELSGNKVAGKIINDAKPNKLNLKIAASLMGDSDIKELALKGTPSIAGYDHVVDQLYQEITTSNVFSDFSKKRSKTVDDEIELWKVLIDTVLAKSKPLETAARQNENFTLNGFNIGLKMFRDTLTEYYEITNSLSQARQSLQTSLDKAYELYHLLLLLPVEITRMERDRIESAKEKYIPTSQDLNPNTRLVDNRFIKLLVASPDMEDYLKLHPINLDTHYALIKKLHSDILQSDLYARYMAAEHNDYVADCDFWRTAMKNIILPSDALAEILESSSIYWNDDLEIMGTFAIKTIRQASSAHDSLRLLPQYKDDDDARFGEALFVDTIKNRETYRSYIDKFIDASQWDSERLAFMDIVVMMTAISEILNFPSIPLPVTLNEYIEIANSYSTPRSGQFVNGMLFSIINYLRSEGKLTKN